MDSRGFLGLQRTHNPYRWHLEVTQGLSTPGNFLFGGCGLGAAISAMEGTVDRPCVWATAQYLSFANVGEVTDVDITVSVSGHQISQARAVGHVGNREIFTVNAAFGVRPLEAAGQWETMVLEVPPPEACPSRPSGMPVDGTVNERIDVRIASGRDWDDLDGTPGDGRTVAWAHIPEVIEGVDAATLAILGDFVPMGVGQALGIRGGGTSLDNTLRIVRLVPTKWVLLDIKVHAVDHGFGHGLAHMFAEDGTLLATASQSCAVRFWLPDQDGGPPR